MAASARYVCCIGLSCLFLPVSAAADPVSVTSGFVWVTDPSSQGPISISGTRGFSIEGFVSPLQGRVDPFHIDCVFGCLPGSTISLGAAFFGSAVAGTATLDGNDYALTQGVDDPAAAGLEFVASAMVPALTGSSLVLSVPFHLTGSTFSTPAGDAALRGHGLVSLSLSPSPPISGLPRGWAVDGVRYDFSDAAPVPEPGTLTLFSMSLAVAAVRARLRRKENL